MPGRSQSVFPCALSSDARQSWVQASCTHPSVSLPFLTMNRQRLLLGPHYPTSFASKLCFPGLLQGTAPTPPLDSAQKRRRCQQDSWEDTLAQTLVGFKCFATPLGHVLRNQVHPRCLKAPGQRSLAPNLCTQVPLGLLRFGLGTPACLLAPVLAVQLPASPKGTNARQTEMFHSILVTCSV